MTAIMKKIPLSELENAVITKRNELYIRNFNVADARLAHRSAKAVNKAIYLPRG